MESEKWSFNGKNILGDLAYDVIGSLLLGCGVYTFALNAGYAPGGVSGLSIIMNHLTGLPIGALSLLFNIPMILFGFKMLGKVYLLKSIKTIIINSLFLDFVFPHLPVYLGNPLLASIFTGVFVGAACGILYMRGSSTGGVDFIILGLKKIIPFLSMGQIMFIIDGSIVLLGSLVFRNVDAVLYGVITTVSSTIVLDKLMSGAGSGKMAIIITKDAMKAAEEISAVIDRGSTLVKGIGTYSGQEREMLFCACGNRQIYKLRQVMHQLDSKALIMITDTHEVFGEGFQNLE